MVPQVTCQPGARAFPSLAASLPVRLEGSDWMPQAAERTGLHFFPEMLPAWQESSLDVHISCWSLGRARGPRGVAASGEKGMLCGLRWVASFPSCSSWGDLGLTSSCLLLRSEAPQECDRGLVWPAGPSLMRPFPPEAWMALVPSSPSPQPRALLGRPGLKLPPTLKTGPELLPPSSFMPCGVEAPARVSPPGHLGVILWLGLRCFSSGTRCCCHS